MCLALEIVSFLLPPLWGALPLLIYVEGSVYMTSPSPTRTPHVTRPSNLYKEGQGTPRGTSKKKQSLRLDTTRGEPVMRRLPDEHNET